MKLTLHAGVSQRVTLDATWLHLEQAIGKVEIVRESTNQRVRLGKSAVFKVESGVLDRLTLTSEKNTQIEIEYGHGSFVPPVEGQSVNLGAAVAIAPNQSIAVERLPPVVIAPDQALSVSTLPAIEIADGQRVKIDTMPVMKVAANQSIGVETLPPVVIAADQTVTAKIAPSQTVKVEVAPNQKIGIQNDVQIRTKQTFNVREVANDTFTTTKGTAFPFAIAADKTRVEIHIKAAATNANDILLGDYPLGAGETIKLKTRAELIIDGEAGDVAYVLEC